MLEEKWEFDRLDALALAALGTVIGGAVLRSVDWTGEPAVILTKVAGGAAVVGGLWLYAVLKWRVLERALP